MEKKLAADGYVIPTPMDPLNPKDVDNFVLSHFGSFEEGTSYLTSAFYEIYSRTIDITLQRFSKEELHGMREAMYDVELQPYFVGDFLESELEFAVMEVQLDLHCHFNFGELKAKLAHSSFLERVCLEIWAYKNRPRSPLHQT